MRTLRLPVDDSSQIGGARREARSLAVDLGFDHVAVEKVAIVATEAATNLLIHGKGGVIYIQATFHTPPLLELFAVDGGPGFRDWKLCRTDGFSTAGTPGNGIGAIERNSDFSEFYSIPERGTVLVARFSGVPHSEHDVSVAGLQTSKPGEDVCGDAWAWRRDRHSQIVIVADGLGHGPEAAAAARTAVEFLPRANGAKPIDLLEAVHNGIRHTRGAAVGIAELNQETRTVVFAGLGNIAARICESDTSSRHLVSMNGTAGMETRTRFRDFTYPWPEGSILILHSDGLTGRWEMNPYPRLLHHDLGVICGVLLRDFSRGNDDATVVAVK